jgi:hypothetical protein
LKHLLITGILLGLLAGTLAGQINEKRSLSETSHMIYQAAYDPTGEFITTTGSDNNIIIWNASSGIIYRTLVGLKKRPNQAVFSGDGKQLFSAGEDGLITTWDPSLMRITGTASGHTGAIKALAINPAGTLLASGGEDRVVRVWSVDSGRLALVYELKGHKKGITTLAFSPKGNWLVSGGADRKLIMWDMKSGGMVKEVEAHAGWVRYVRYSPDGTQLCSGGDDNLIRIWDAKDLTEIRVLKGHTGWVQTLAYTPSGNYIISGGHDATVRIWNVETGTMVGVSDKLEQIVLSVDASPVKNDFISSCLLSEHLRIWANEFEEAPLARVKSDEPQGPVDREQPSDLEQPPGRETVPVTATEATIAGEQGGDPGTGGDVPQVVLFSPTLKDGRVVHNGTSILIIGKAEGAGGIQTVLINRQRAALSDAGVFQLEIPLSKGENPVELVAVSFKGKMSRTEMVIQCTSEAAPDAVAARSDLPDGRYYGLIIGINDYEDENITDLDFPIQDAESVYKILTGNYAFRDEDITFLKNPTRTEIFNAMDELVHKVGENDNLLIFYAGHGHWDEKTGIGYWLPRDATKANTANWLGNSALRDFIGSIPSKHTLLIADACFSGSIFKTRSAFPTENQGIRKLLELRSRKAMTSGALKEVPDQSVFVKYLIQELKQNESRYLPSEELFSSFKTAVLNNSPNVPQYGTIQNVGDEGGDFVFVKSNDNQSSE